MEILAHKLAPVIHKNNNNSFYGHFPLSLTMGLAGRFQQHSFFILPNHDSYTSTLFSSPFLILVHYPIWFHAILSLPLPLMSSNSYNMLLFSQSPTSFCNTCPSHLNRLLLTTPVATSVLFSSSALQLLSYRSVTHHTSITSLSTRIVLPALHSWPQSYFQTPLHSSHMFHTPSLLTSRSLTAF